MYVLALDSTAQTATCALTEDEIKIAEYTLCRGMKHSQTLLPMISAMLDASCIKIDDIDLFTCSAGPGSFTGVRIGTATIKGLAFGKNRPCIGVSSLQALAFNMTGTNGIVCPVMDARRNQVYCALFEQGKRLTEDMIITTDELKEMLAKTSEETDIYFVGDGYELCREQIKLSNIKDTPQARILQSAYSVAVIGYRNYKNIININTDSSLKPVYLRASQAERERKEKEKNERG